MTFARFSCFPLLFDLIVSLVLLNENELAPSLLKLSLIENSTLSMAVSIPTRQVIPIAIISSVRRDRTQLSLILPRAIFMFSVTFTL